MWGTDQSVSLSEDGIKNLTDILKKSEADSALILSFVFFIISLFTFLLVQKTT